MPTVIPIAAIRTDGGTQTRERVDQETVDSYADAMQAGAEFPAIVVFYDGSDYWLADGFHRLDARKATGFADAVVEIKQGTRRDAILFSVGANATNALRRTNADKRRAVSTLLSDEEWSRRSDRWIAEKCAVSHPFVIGIRKELVTVTSSQSRSGQDGKTRKMPERTSLSRPSQAANDLVDEDDDGEPEIFEADDDTKINPDFEVGKLGSFDVSALVAQIGATCRECREGLDRIFGAIDPRIKDDVKKRAEDSILRLFDSAMAHMPVDSRRADENRKRFHVVTGGK